MTSQKETASLGLERFQRPALIVGAVAAVLCVVGAFLNYTQFLQSYLYAFLFWNGATLGCLAALMLQHLVGGRWGLAVRRLAEAGALLVPLMAVLFIPIIIGMNVLYPWTHETSALIEHKRAYLNTPGFILRAVLYFAIWGVLGYLLNRWSELQDRTGIDPAGRWMRMLSGGGIVLYVLCVTFASTDWGMSLTPEWFSAIYGVVFIIGHGLTFWCLMILLLAFLGKKTALDEIVWPDIFHDIGKLLFAFVVLWTYANFSQFVIMWTGNLPEDLPWYYVRTSGGWQYVAYILAGCQFLLPFLLLLSRRNKRRIGILCTIAGGLLVMRLIDLFWWIKPNFYDQFQIVWTDVVALVAIGGFWIAAYIWAVQRKPLVPVHDPRLTIVKYHRAHFHDHDAPHQPQQSGHGHSHA